jgi:NADH dehydrogenase/NADH:ubiquinone oxidoreductase subunit G
MVLAQAGRGATAARDEYAASDAKFADEQDRLRDIITKAKIEGNTGVANAGMKALEQLRMDHQNARTSGTSLLNTEEQTAERRERARQHNQVMAANRATAAEQRNMTNAINAIKADPMIDKLLKDAEALGKMPTAANQAKAALIEQRIADLQRAIYKQFGVLQGGGTMGAAPGAGSPSGTNKPGWGIKPLS